MFATPVRSTFAGSASLAHAYRQVGAATSVSEASPHKLIELLFDGFMEAVTRARGALAARQIEAKGLAISHAARIVDEGLKASLNLSGGGRLAADLRDLYTYVSLRLVLANVRNDASILDECVELIEPLRQAWKDIAPQVEGLRQ